jgi:hypothetical protein
LQILSRDENRAKSDNEEPIIPDYAISSIDQLPSIAEFQRRLQVLAALDAIIMPAWDMRHFSFNSKWGAGEMMSSMKDGQGSDFHIIFSEQGVAGKIHCISPSPNGNASLSEVPDEFGKNFKEEEAFVINQASNYFWRKSVDVNWNASPSGALVPYMGFVVDVPSLYLAWAERYYERKINAQIVGDLFVNKQLSTASIRAINSDGDIDTIKEEIITEIGLDVVR